MGSAAQKEFKRNAQAKAAFESVKKQITDSTLKFEGLEEEIRTLEEKALELKKKKQEALISFAKGEGGQEAIGRIQNEIQETENLVEKSVELRDAFEEARTQLKADLERVQSEANGATKEYWSSVFEKIKSDLASSRNTLLMAWAAKNSADSYGNPLYSTWVPPRIWGEFFNEVFGIPTPEEMVEVQAEMEKRFS